MATGLQAQHTKSALKAVERDAFNQTGEYFLL